ncbi:leucine-rich repeat and coiled-coil domain-containing protein [Acrasis kona]|uniref:Leucine-rich repeat and coiled-coil domain-containing protein n=1 Tax=Acrasis kona TaxID=1008807 RepID=A0AAW2YRW4_9EUKA
MDDYDECEFVGENIKSISELKKQHPMVIRSKTLKLHWNVIRKITDLNDFVFLVELDLSGNQIEKIEGLDTLMQLQNLNLASNRKKVTNNNLKISTIENLNYQTKLRRLNLSYNSIESLQGLASLHGEKYSLECLDVRGNNIHALREIQYLSGCVNLQEVYLQNKGVAPNPVCLESRYEEFITSKLPRLSILDGNNSDGLSDTSSFHHSDTHKFPILDKYIEYMVDANDVVSKQSAAQPNQTDPVFGLSPKYDNVVKNFRKRSSDSLQDKKIEELEQQVQLLRSQINEAKNQTEAVSQKNPVISIDEPSPRNILITTEISTQTDHKATHEASIQASDDTFLQKHQDIVSTLRQMEKEEMKSRSHIERLCQEVGSTKTLLLHREEELEKESCLRIKLQDTVALLQKESETQKKSIKDAYLALNLIKKENEALKNYNGHIQRELNHCKMELEKVSNVEQLGIEKMRVAYETERKMLRKQLEELKASTQNLQEQLTSAHQELKHVNSLYNRSLDEQTKVHNQEVSEMLKRQSLQIEQTKKEAQEEREKIISDSSLKLKQTINEFQNRIQELQNECSRSESSFNEALIMNKELKASLNLLVQNDIRLSASNKELISSVEQLKSSLEKTQKNRLIVIKESQETFKSYETQIQDMNKKYQDKVPKLENDIRELTNQLKSKEDHISQLESQLQVLQKNHSELTKKQLQFENEKSELNQIHSKTVKQLNDDFTKYKQEFEQLKCKSLIFESPLTCEIDEETCNKHMIDSKNKEIEMLKKRKLEIEDDCKKKLKNMQQTMENELQSQNEMHHSDFVEEIQRGKEKIGKLRQQRDDLEIELKYCDEQITNLEDKLASKRNELDLKSKELKNLENVINDSKQLHLKEKSRLENNVLELSMKLKNVEGDLDKCEQDKKKIILLLQKRQKEVQFLITKYDAQQKVAEQNEMKLKKFLTMADDLKS